MVLLRAVSGFGFIAGGLIQCCLSSPFLPVRNAAASDEPQGGNAPEAACVLPVVV